MVFHGGKCEGKKIPGSGIDSNRGMRKESTVSSTLFEAAAERAGKTWKIYIVALCILQLTLVIDAMSGLSFLGKGGQIDLAGFKVVREALSATYGILFAVFIGAAYLESGLLLRSAGHTSGSILARPAALDLWFISPFSHSRFLRGLFWAALFNGFILLGVFAWVHVAGWGPPRSGTVPFWAYRAIGVVDLLVLIVCLEFARRIRRNLRKVRSKLGSSADSPGSGKRPKMGTA